VRLTFICETKSGDLPGALRANCSPRERARRAGAPSISSCSTRLQLRVGRSFYLLTPSRFNVVDFASIGLRVLANPGLHLLTLAVLLVSASSCSNRESKTTYVKTVSDELGRSVKVPVHPERIVSLAPSITEVLFALGAGDRVAGVTSYCDYPPEAREKTPVGDTLKPSVEKIVALKADLVIVSTASQIEASFRKMDELGIPVYVTNPRSVDGVLESINALGELIDSGDRAKQLSGELRGRIAAVETRVANANRPRILVLLGTEPLITVGAGSFVTDLINRAGAQSISSDDNADYPQYSIETVIAKQPEIILLQSGGTELTPRLLQTPAGRSNRVYHIDDDLLLRPGPRIIDALEQLALKVHPEIFEPRNQEPER